MSNQSKSTILMSVLAVTFSAFSAFLGEPFIPFASALVAAIWVTDRTVKHAASIIVSTIVLLLNGLVGGLVSVIGLEILLITAVIAFAFARKRSKAEAALILTVLVAVCIVTSLIFGAMNETKVYTLESVEIFYEEMFTDMRAGFTEMVETYISAMPSKSEEVVLSTNDINAIFDAMVGSLIGVILVIAFAVAGFSLKIFTAIMRRLTPEDAFLADWRFLTPPAYAYSYLALYLVSIFLRGNGALALTVANLSTVFMAVYAYVGFDAIVSIASQKFGKAKTLAVALLVLLFLSTFAMQLLALFGAYATIATAKLGKSRGDGL